MPLDQILPAAAALGILIFACCLLWGYRIAAAQAWLLPAGLSGALFVWSLYAVSQGGPFGFWMEHTRNTWGVQILFDLLLGIGVALAFVVPKARALGMATPRWVVFVLATGSIGLCAMMARVQYLEARAPANNQAT